MRIGYIGYFGDWHTEWGVSNALEKYARVDRYELAKLDKTKFTERRYDIVLTTGPYGLPVEFWKAQAGVLVAHYFDLIHGWRGREKQYFPTLKHFDLTLSTDGTSGKEYKKAGINRRYLKQAFNPEWYYPVKSKGYDQDVAFIGGMYTPQRRHLLHELGKRFDFAHYGWRNDCRGEDHSEVCAKSKIMVCDNAINDIPGYWSNRVYLHLACGAFVLHPRVPGMEEVFKDEKHLVYYDNLPDLYRKIRIYLGRGDLRARIAEAGCDLVHKQHTWDKRMEEMWPLISGLVSSATQTAKAESGCSCGISGPALARTVSFQYPQG